MNTPAERRARRVAWALTGLVVVWAAVAFGFGHERYHNMRSEWAYDLAYFNQFYWAPLHGGELTVRPVGPWFREGPESWRMNVFQPFRYLLFPFYTLAPGPPVLLLLQTLFLAAGALFAFRIARRRSSSEGIGVAAVCLYLAVPAALGFALNDFRITHFGLPVGLACHYFGVERRNLPAFLGCAALLLTVREDFTVIVLYLALLAGLRLNGAQAPPRGARAPAMALWGGSAAALVVAYSFVVGWARSAMGQGGWRGPYPLSFSDGPTPGVDLSIVGPLPELMGQFGALGLLGLLAPLLAAPGWLGLLYLRSQGQYFGGCMHHATPFLILAVPAAIVGMTRLRRWLAGRPWGAKVFGLVLVAAVSFEGARVVDRLQHWPAASDDSRAVNELAEGAPDAAVTGPPVAAAVLSSRSELYVYGESDLELAEMLARSDHVVVTRADLADWRAAGVTLAGFEVIHDGEGLVIARRAGGATGGCPAGMAFVPGGPYVIGVEVPVLHWHKAAVEVQLEPFCMDLYEYPNVAGREPLASVAWTDAHESCASNGKRLCSSAEWERACRGPQRRIHTYGNERDRTACNTPLDTEGPGDEGPPLAPSGSHPRCVSAEGVYDLGGNLSEWVSDTWYDFAPGFDPTPVSDPERWRTVRGGTMWVGTFYGQDCTSRHGHPADEEWWDDGFRCCADADHPG